MTEKTVTQCKSCPWRIDCEPDKDIPNYRPELHCALKKTIRSGLESLTGDRHIMACHYSKPGAELHCAGWLYNQINDGNNVAARIQVMTGRWPVPVIDGEQHPRFEDTIPRGNDGEETRAQHTTPTRKRVNRRSAKNADRQHRRK